MARIPTLRDRTSGILLHPTGLPGPHGAGDLGPSAHRFLELLAAAGQRWWQMLPCVPGASPYQGTSAFAGDPMLVSLLALVEDGFLSPEEVADDPSLGGIRIDFARRNEFREARLRRAFEAFRRDHRVRDEFMAFCAREAGWLTDWAIFAAAKTKVNGSWTAFPEGLRRREPGALEAADRELRDEVRFQQFVQFMFVRQWESLRRHAESLGIGLIGDIPIFVGHDSVDVWARPEEFCLDDRGEPSVVAGVPPDYFSATGQRWGNALYRWDVHKQHGYDWWIGRLRQILARFHAVRVDHFIGFHRYWEIQASCPTAVEGRWMPGPGDDFFQSALSALGGLPLIAEDLGVITQEVRDLRDKFGLPGMRILQFAFGLDAEARNFQPHAFPPGCVVYTGTHDNDTTVGWYEALLARAGSDERARGELDFALRYAKSDGKKVHWDMIQLAMMSPANTAIFPLQDVLGQDATRRMNLPGTTDGNWAYRVTHDELAEADIGRLRMLTDTYART